MAVYQTLLLSFIITFVFIAPAKSQSGKPVTDFPQIQAMVDSNRFEMEYTIATTHYSYFLEPGTPYSDQNIRIGQDSAFIIIRDSVAAGYLPYYSSGYSFPQTGLRGIVFKNKIQDLTVNAKGRGRKQSITYGFSIAGINDTYRINIIIQNTGICYLYVNSTKRSPISYIGQIIKNN